MTNQKSKFWILICSFTFCISSFALTCFAQDNNKLVALTKQIIEAKTDEELHTFFKEVKDLYFKDNRYTDFIDFLKSLSDKKKTLAQFSNYYIALSRYEQLKYLEEKQAWDEYFSQGNTYRDELVQYAQEAINATDAKNSLHLYGRLILWQFHQDQQDVFSEQALWDLMNSALEYSQAAKDIAPLKQVADTLLSYAEKAEAKELYKLYVDKLASSSLKDEELATLASDFYQEANLELSKAIYEVYLGRIAKYPKEKLIQILKGIAQDFAFKDEGIKDELYAEGIFKKLEQIGGKESFDEGLIYLRAFNLEKIKEYVPAKDIYLDLINRFPQTTHRDEVIFKLGIIYTYILRDIGIGRNYFEKLAQKDALSPQVISSLYQLGLLSQWEEDAVKAKEYYMKLLEKAKDNFAETITLTQERLKEIEAVKPIEYNLKNFLDVSLKEEYRMFDMTKLDLKTSFYRPKRGQQVNINSLSFTPESGCMQIELQYLWSGSLGTAQPSLDDSKFDTTYLQAGTKEINLVVVSSAGILDRNIELIDVD